MQKRTQTKEKKNDEQKEWSELYEYVKRNIMNYDDNQSLSRIMVLRLKGLRTSKFIENKSIKDNSNYSFTCVLNTFKFCKPKIDYILKTKKFQDENHKFNYILKVAESNLNEVYKKMLNAKRNEIIKETSINTDHKSANFISKPQKAKTVQDKYKDYW